MYSLLKMGMFHFYVSLPEGITFVHFFPQHFDIGDVAVGLTHSGCSTNVNTTCHGWNDTQTFWAQDPKHIFI